MLVAGVPRAHAGLMHERLQIDAQGSVSADDDVGADAEERVHVAHRE
jgi:hypothetical protein